MRHDFKYLAVFTGLLWACCACAASAPGASMAEPAPAFGAEVPRIDLAAFVEFIEDPEHKLTISDVTGVAASRFRHWAGPGDVNLGFGAASYWLRVPLARTAGSRNRLLEIAYANLDRVTLHAPGRDPVTTGQADPAAQRPWPDRFFVFPLELAEETKYFYLQVRTASPVTVPLVLWEPAAFAAHTQKTYLGLALYYGEILALVAYNFLIFVALRERVFLHYTVFAALMGLAIMFGNGIGQQYLWPQHLRWSEQIPVALYALVGASGLAFSRSFLQTQIHLPTLDRMMALTLMAYLGIVVMPFLGVSVGLAWQAMSLLSMLACVLIVWSGIVTTVRGVKSARFFLLAWGILLTGAFTAVARNFGILPTTLLTGYALQFSSAAEMLLLSFALADRIRLERNAREAAQAETLAARQSLVESLRASEAKLERTVAERTAELSISLQNEQSLLEQYVRFGAFISHEFRNPLGVIKSQLALIAKEKSRGIDHLDRRLAAVIAAAGRLHALFDDWLNSDRLQQHTQVLSPTAIELASWLEEIVEYSRNRYASHSFVLHAAVALPTISADEPMLRIALLNLIDNAAKYAPAGTAIAIETTDTETEIGIAIVDAGPGIAREHRDEVFSDYFRAAPSGGVPGFGLGLALVKKVAELHRGRVELTSETGQGCRFSLWLPRSASQGGRA